MGNAGLRKFKRAYERWVRSRPTCLQYYVPFIPQNILKLVRTVTLHKEIYSIDRSGSIKNVFITPVGTKGVYNSDIHVFRVRFDSIIFRFNGSWHIDLPFQYIILCSGDSFFENNVEPTLTPMENACDERFACRICFTHYPTEAFIPCGHTICSSCANLLNKETCPFCRTSIYDRMRIYL